jgi:two-component system chemotaxis response regulator CheY
MKFLVVDDSATLRKIMAMGLGEQGHSVEEAENGKVALDKLKGSKPNCIILDINGIEFLTEKSKNPEWTTIPVVVLTTQDEEELRKKAVSLGANGFLAKPFDKAVLLATLKQIVG